ncbi:hypothetical protein SH661x_002295 [Planctomicrobium sp. SH661]|uniref:hypothetical protein n=1 Tax=Planctomicrobium sp. SH661 TaxID=3448124 RepID=UPI003F5C85F4
MSKKSVSSKDLTAALSSIHHRFGDGPMSARLQKLESASSAAQEKLNDFTSKCQPLRRLQAAATKARLAYDRASRKECESRSEDVRRAMNLIRLNGPTPEVIREVSRVVKKYGG